MNDTEQICPLCKQEVQKNARYPNYVCHKCLKEHGTYTEDGKKITFYNPYIDGGFESLIEGDSKPSYCHICFINGVKCYASEARFGGIVIQSINN